LRRFLIISICILCFLGVIFTACFLAFIPPSGPQAVNRDGLLELNGVTIVRPGIGQEAYRTIRVADGRIVAIHESVNSEGPYAKMFVTPGLIDMHAHLPPDNLLKLIPYFSLLYLSHGVTTLRIAGDLDGTATPVVREAFAKGTFAVPRVYSCDRFVTAGKPRWKNSIVVNSPDDAPAVIQELIDDRADCMKLYENLTIPMIRSLVSEARKAGLPVIGHVPTQLRYEDASSRMCSIFLEYRIRQVWNETTSSTEGRTGCLWTTKE